MLLGRCCNSTIRHCTGDNPSLPKARRLIILSVLLVLPIFKFYCLIASLSVKSRCSIAMTIFAWAGVATRRDSLDI